MELIKLSAKEFSDIARLVYDRTGIFLADEKLVLLSNRLRKRLRALKLETFQDYYALLKDPARCEDELPHFLSAVTTNETYFFRNENLWNYIREQWIPHIAERKKKNRIIRVWSAASSTGAEAYTTAMTIAEHLPEFASWQVQVIGSDISQRVLDAASEGVYDEYAVSRTPKPTLARWFEPHEGKHRVKAEIRKFVTFKFHNLRDAFPRGDFDLVFLRNVLMYFDTKMKIQALMTVKGALLPGGRLIVGDVDPIRNMPELSAALQFNAIATNVYQKPEAAPSAAGAKREFVKA